MLSIIKRRPTMVILLFYCRMRKWTVELCDGWAPLKTRYDDDDCRIPNSTADGMALITNYFIWCTSEIRFKRIVMVCLSLCTYAALEWNVKLVHTVILCRCFGSVDNRQQADERQHFFRFIRIWPILHTLVLQCQIKLKMNWMMQMSTFPPYSMCHEFSVVHWNYLSCLIVHFLILI